MLIFLLDELSDNIENGYLHNRNLITFLLSKIESSIIDLVGTGDAELQASKKYTKDKGIESELYYNVHEKVPYPTRSEGFMTVDDTTNELEIQSDSSQVDRALFVRIVTGVIRNRTVSVYNDRFATTSSSSSSSSSTSSRARYITDAIQSLSSYLRLASKCHVIIHNNLNEIDCFLGMPLELPCYSSLNCLGDYSESIQIDMLWSLKYAVDWLREVLNAFCYSGVVNKLLYGKLLFVMNKLLNAEDAMAQYAQQCVPFLRVMEILDNDSQISTVNDTKKQQGLFTSLLKTWKSQNSKKKNTTTVTPEIPPNIHEIQAAFATIYRKLHPYVCVLIGFGAHTQQSIHSSPSGIGSILTKDSFTKLLELGVYHTQKLFDEEKTCIWSSNDVAEQAPLHNLLLKWQQHGVFCSLSTTITLLGSYFNEINQLQERDDLVDLDDEMATINDKIESIWIDFNHILLLLTVIVSSESLRQNAIASISFHQMDETESSSQSDNTPTIIPILFLILLNISGTNVTAVPVASICEVSLTGIIDLLLHILDIIRPNNIHKKMNFDTIILIINTIEKIILLMHKFPHLDPSMIRHCSHRYSEICEKILVQKWPLEGIAKHVAVILRCRIEYSNNSNEAVTKLYDETYTGAQIIEDNYDEIRINMKKKTTKPLAIHNHYPLLTMITFKSFFTTLFHIITNKMDNIHHQIHIDVTHTKSQGVDLPDFNEHVDNISMFITKCRRLIKLHELDGLELIGIKSMVIKEGGKFIRILLKYIGIMSLIFEQHLEKVLAIIAEIQKITASLTKLFNDSKINRNENDLRYIPAIKKDVEQILFKIKTMLLDVGCDPNDCIEVGTVKSIPKNREKIIKNNEKDIDFTGDSIDDKSVVDGSDLDFLDGMEDDDDVDIDDVPHDDNDDDDDDVDINNDDEEKSVSSVIMKKKSVIKRTTKRAKKTVMTVDHDDVDNEEEEEDNEVVKSIQPVATKKRPAVTRTKKVPIPQESSEEQTILPEQRHSRPVFEPENKKKKRLAQYDTDDSDNELNNENSPVNTLVGTLEDSD